MRKLYGADFSDKNEKGEYLDFDGNVLPDDFYYRIDAIAALIGYALSAHDGIKVTQTKEKYGACCVYCSIEPDKMSEIPICYGFKISAKRYYNMIYRLAIESFPEYKNYITTRADFEEYVENIDED